MGVGDEFELDCEFGTITDSFAIGSSGTTLQVLIESFGSTRAVHLSASNAPGGNPLVDELHGYFIPSNRITVPPARRMFIALECHAVTDTITKRPGHVAPFEDLLSDVPSPTEASGPTLSMVPRLFVLRVGLVDQFDRHSVLLNDGKCQPNLGWWDKLQFAES